MIEKIFFKLIKLNNGKYQVLKRVEYDEPNNYWEFIYYTTRFKFIAILEFKMLVNDFKKQKSRIEGEKVENIILEEEIK